MREQLLAVLSKYQISNKVAYFAADNALNNNKAIKLLTDDLNSNAERQRLRCLGHIINLVSTAILYSVDNNCVEEVLQALEDNVDAGGKALSAFSITIVSADDAP